jgi:hypothetical protein
MTINTQKVEVVELDDIALRQWAEFLYQRYIDHKRSNTIQKDTGDKT